MAGIRGMARQRELLSELLLGTESMRVFITHRMDGDEELRLRLERSKIDLATAQKIVVEKTEALKKVEAERKTTGAKLKEAEQENSKLREKIEELRSGLSLNKKQKEDLQLRFVTQRKELKVGFAVQRKALETECQFPCLHFSNLERQSGLWACQFSWGLLHPFRMRGQTGCSLSVIRVWFDRPIRRQTALPPTFLWLIPTVSLMRIARSYWLPQLVRCFGGIKGWNIGFYC